LWFERGASPAHSAGAGYFADRGPSRGTWRACRRGLSTATTFSTSSPQFLPDFPDLSGYHGTFTPAHLWFILYLFVISLALLPLQVAVLKRRAKAGVGAFGRLFARGWFLLLLFIPLLASEALPDIAGKNPFYFGLYYVIGFFIASNDASWEAIGRVKWLSAALTASSLTLFLAFRHMADGMDDFILAEHRLRADPKPVRLERAIDMLAFARIHLNRAAGCLRT
jgi:uncharacterized membrane protein YhaH (DUF805 family)